MPYPRHLLIPVTLIALAVGCGAETPGRRPPTGKDAGGNDGGAVDNGDAYGDYDVSNITFLDDARSNSTPVGLVDLVFVDRLGREQRVADFAPGRHVVLVITRGNTTPICPFCSTQTANYIRRYDEFTKRGAEVLIAYPVAFERDRGRLQPFLENVRSRLDDPDRRVPFPILFDVELKAVDQLGIRQDLSKPATYVLDASGRVRYAHVGRDLADRPSVKAVLAELDKVGPAPADSSEADPSEAGDEASGVDPVPEAGMP